MANRRVATEPALYLYGISRSAGSSTTKITNVGIDGIHAVVPLSHEDFVCWVSPIDGAAFSGEISRNRENLEWLALHSVRHQQVVAEIAARYTIVPARFGTVFSGKAALLKNIEGRKAALEKVFKGIADADEWGVKVFSERPAVTQARPEAHSGKEYLQQKAARLKRRPDEDDPDLREFAAALEKIAADSAPSGKISGVQPDLLWQATFLVARGQRKQWDKTLKDFVKKWDRTRRIEVNGPWPPYSFVSDAE